MYICSDEGNYREGTELVNSQDKRTKNQRFTAESTRQFRRNNHFKLYNQKEQR